MYTARTLLRKVQGVEVDMIEMLPTPFGLVRYGGVANYGSFPSRMRKGRRNGAGGERRHVVRRS